MTLHRTHCAIIVGHSRNLQGAANPTSGISEFEFNSRLARHIKRIVSSDTQLSIVYRTSYQKLPEQVNSLNPDFCLSLHCNAFDRKTSGTQTLYFHNSSESKALAEALQSALVNCLDLRNRGTTGVRENGRGAHLLKNVKAPCIIAEPFFIDNDSDLGRGLERFEELVSVYAEFISSY